MSSSISHDLLYCNFGKLSSDEVTSLSCDNNQSDILRTWSHHCKVRSVGHEDPQEVLVSVAVVQAVENIAGLLLFQERLHHHIKVYTVVKEDGEQEGAQWEAWGGGGEGEGEGYGTGEVTILRIITFQYDNLYINVHAYVWHALCVE